MTIEAELNALDITKSAIKQAIIDKGVSVSASDSFSTYPAKIEQIQTGSEPTLETLTVVPSTTAQTLTPPSGVDGFDEVSVNAVTAAIDSDIQAGNIKSGVEILGVTGTYTGEGANLQSKTLTVDSTTPTVSTVAPDSGYDGLSSVTVDMTYVEDRLDTVLGTSVVPTGTLSITANGVYDVTNYASANVSVSGSSTIQTTPKANFAIMEDGGISGIWIPTDEVDSEGNLIHVPFVGSNWEDAVGREFMYLGYVASYGHIDYDNYGGFNIVHLSLANITTIPSDFSSQFIGDENPTVQTIDLSGLRVIEGGSDDFLIHLGYGQVNLTDIYFNSLNSNSFVGFNASFAEEYQVFRGMFISTGTQVVHTAHFPSNLEPIISQFVGYPLFGGTQGYVNIAFDLPATT